MKRDPEPHDEEPTIQGASDQPLPSSGWELPPNHDEVPPPQDHQPPSQPPQGHRPQHQPSQHQPPFQQPSTNPLSVMSMVVGIIAIPALCACGIGFFGGVAAVVMGIVSRERIRSSHGMQTGESQALTGIICGSIAIVAGTVFGLGFFIL